MIKLDTTDFDKGLIRIAHKLNEGVNPRKLTGDISLFLAARIKTRTKQGRDKFMNPFSPYAESTKKSRARRGRGVDKVTLTDSGLMMAGIGTKQISDDEAEVNIFDTFQQKKAALHNFGGRVHRKGKHVGSYTVDYPRRAFFGTSDEDTVTNRGIEKILKTAGDNAVREAAKNG